MPHSYTLPDKKSPKKIIPIKIEGFFEGKLTNQKYRKLVGGLDPKTAQRDLGQLVEQGIFLKRGERKGTHYVLSQTDQG